MLLLLLFFLLLFLLLLLLYIVIIIVITIAIISISIIYSYCCICAKMVRGWLQYRVNTGSGWWCVRDVFLLYFWCKSWVDIARTWWYGTRDIRRGCEQPLRGRVPISFPVLSNRRRAFKAFVRMGQVLAWWISARQARNVQIERPSDFPQTLGPTPAKTVQHQLAWRFPDDEAMSPVQQLFHAIPLKMPTDPNDPNVFQHSRGLPTCGRSAGEM